MTIGDRVRLKADWSYRGTIIAVHPHLPMDTPFDVRWDNGTVELCFGDDLEVIG